MELEIKKEGYEDGFKPDMYAIERIAFQINVVIMAMLNGFKIEKRWLN